MTDEHEDQDTPASSSDAHDVTDEAVVGDDEESAEIRAFDLDHDGKISASEDFRAELGLLDAKLEQVIEEDGIKGKLAKGVHKILDKLDND